MNITNIPFEDRLETRAARGEFDPKRGTYFVFREKDGRLRALSWRRWVIPDNEVVAWANSLAEAKEIIARMNQDKNEPLFVQGQQRNDGAKS